MIFTPNDNATIVASFDGQTPVESRAYEVEIREYQESREYATIENVMRERSAVRL